MKLAIIMILGSTHINKGEVDCSLKMLIDTTEVEVQAIIFSLDWNS